jgi:glucokinase
MTYTTLFKKPNQRQSATAGLIRRLNRSAILDQIRSFGPISRVEISRNLSMSMPTVMRLVDGLISEDLVRALAGKTPSGGRPRTLLEFNGESYCVIGIDLGGTKMFGTVADLNGKIQIEKYIPWKDTDKDSLICLNELLVELINSPKTKGQRIRGIGIGAPGVTRNTEGIVEWAPSLGWRNLPLKQILENRYQLPVFVENDVNLAALGEYGFGSAKGASSLVCIAIGTGIGSGIVINRAIYRGFHQAAGEIGYLLPSRSDLQKKYHHFGALESLASGTGIAERGKTKLSSLEIPVPEDLSAEDIFLSAAEGQTWARDVVEETVDYLSLGIASVTSVLDPEVIILGGGVSKSADVLIPLITNRLKDSLAVLPRIEKSILGYRATVMGAIILVLDITTEYVSINE